MVGQLHASRQVARAMLGGMLLASAAAQIPILPKVIDSFCDQVRKTPSWPRNWANFSL
jgi:hypothetical protein